MVLFFHSCYIRKQRFDPDILHSNEAEIESGLTFLADDCGKPSAAYQAHQISLIIKNLTEQHSLGPSSFSERYGQIFEQAPNVLYLETTLPIFSV